jgi:hypothetical protein
MLKISICLIAFCLSLNLCAQTKLNSGGNGLTVEASIRVEVEKHIENSKDYDVLKDKMQVYNNSVFAEFYENDGLVFTSNNKTIKRVFNHFIIGNAIP